MENQSITKLKKPNNSLVATKDSVILREIMPLMNLPENHHKAGFLKAIGRFNVTEEELEDGFWKAYADHFTPQTGIEFKHIFKHIKEKRDERFEQSKYIVRDGGTW